MKKALTYSIIFVATLLLSSCVSNLSITKRHFNNGYYVENGKSKHVEKGSNDKIALERSGKQKDVDQHEPLNTVPENGSVQNDVNENNVSIQHPEKENNKAETDHVANGRSMNHADLALYPLTHIKSAFAELKRTGSVPQDDEGLSLFWIIILIILILWAIGVISEGFAITSIINLLLLAALILLILWLLRVV